METEQARHETEESLILAQFGTSHNISHKLQNGGQSTEGDSLQVTGDTNWNLYKSSTGANSMKRHRENCSNSASDEGLFDQASYMMNRELMNGELKHALSEQSLLVHQSKKIKVDSEFKGNDDLSSSLVDNFPELTKSSEFECSSPQTDIKLDKRNCNFPNGDFFCPRNKQVPNGAISPPSTIESTPGDLLEKTLSHYYPEQVSISPQTSGSQLGAVNGSLANKLSSEGAQSPLPSGLPNSAQMPDSQQQQPGVSGNAEGGNNYNSVNYVVNGYSNNFRTDHQQQQQQQQPPSYSDQEMALGQLPGMIPPTSNANNLQQHPNGARCYPDDTNAQGVYSKSHQDFNHSSFMEHSNDLPTAKTGGYGSFPTSGLQKMGQNEKPESGQHPHHGTDRGLQCGIQSHDFKETAGNLSRADSAGPMRPSVQQSHHTGLENGMENTSQQRANSSCSTFNQRGWVQMHSPHSQKQAPSVPSSQAQEQDMWRSFPPKPQSEQQTANQVFSQMLEPNSVQRLQTQAVFTDGSFQKKQQDCLPAKTHHVPAQHNTAPEWQQSKSEAPQMQQPLSQKIAEHSSFHQHQQSDNYPSQVQTEHLCEDPDLQDILSPGFLPTQQQQQQQHCNLPRPLSHPPQFDGQHLKSPNYRPHSQPQPGQQPLQPNQLLGTNSAQTNHQHTPQSDHTMFSYNNTKEMQQHRITFPLNSSSSSLKQFQPQQPNNHCPQPNHVPQMSTQSQPHLPQGALNQEVTTQMYIKAEQQLKSPCTQFQRGPRLPLGSVDPHVDFQRHEALRMHLLKRQEHQGLPRPPQSSSDPKHVLKAVKMENGPRFEMQVPQQMEQQLQMREAGIGQMQVKQEKQQFLCEQSKKQGSILASMEQSLRQYQLSPVFEKKSLVINSSNKVKVESSGPVTILSTNTDVSGIESSASASTVLPKKTPDSTPKKEQLLQSFMDSPMKLLDTPIKNLLDTPMKTQYDIASCHCVGEFHNVAS